MHHEIEAKTVLARKLQHQGSEYHMALVQISPDRRDISVRPFVAETPGTIFISSPICSNQTPSGLWHLAYQD